jgi:Rod binding domain-containing protein
MTDTSFQNMAEVAMAQAQTSGAIKFNHHASLDVIDKKSKDFESMFMSQMLQPMFEGVGVDPLFGGGHGEEVMRSFLIQEYGKAMSVGGHLGIADAVKSALIRSQDAAMKNQPLASQGAAYATAQ